MGKLKKKDAGLIVFAIFGAVVVFLVVWLVYNLLTPKVTNTSSEQEKKKHSAIVCTASVPEGAFFSASGVGAQTHTIKAAFEDDKVTKISYQYEGNFETEAAADKANTNFHIDYNEYMGADAESLGPSFAAIKTKARINFLAERSQLNSKNARLFFLNAEDVSDLANFAPEKIEKMYEARGFSCKIDE